MFTFQKKLKTGRLRQAIRNGSGFSLVECIIALLVLMVGALAVIMVFNYSIKNNNSARRRFGALLMAQQRLEATRNITFNNLANGTTTENDVVSDGFHYKVVRTITSNDLVTVSTAPGPETKLITITVTPFNSTLTTDAVTLSTFRAVNRPGPNREPNTP